MSNVVAFTEQNNLKFLLSSSDPRNLFKGLNIIFEQEFLALSESGEQPDVFLGFPAQEIWQEFQDQDKAALRTERQIENFNTAKKIDTKKISALMQPFSVKGMLRTASDFMAERILQNKSKGVEIWTRENRKAALREKFQNLKKIGFSTEDIRRLYSVLKVWPIFTPHPTEDKSEFGDDAFRRLVSIAEQTPVAEREQALRGLVQEMLRNRLTPEKKLTRRGEIDVGLKHKSVWNDGALDWLYDTAEAINEVYGEDTVDYTDQSQTPDIVATSWHNVDVDGKKVPAPVVFVQRLLDAQGGIDEIIMHLKTGDAEDQSAEVAEVLEYLDNIKSKIDKMCDPENLAILETLDSKNKYYKEQMQVFVDIFEKTPYKGDISPKGPSLPQTLQQDLQSIYKKAKSGTAFHEGVFKTIVHYNINGIATGRQQPRHDHNNYKAIYANLFDYLKKNPKLLGKEAIFYPDGAGFEKLRDDEKSVLLVQLLKNHKKDLGKWFLAANPGGYSDSHGDDKTWLGELLGHIELFEKCFNHRRMGVTVVANAQLMSATMGQVLYQALGIENSIRMDLNEERATIDHAAQKLKFHADNLGIQVLDEQDNAFLREFERHYLATKTSYSDSQKGDGLFIRVNQYLSLRKEIALALEYLVPVVDQKGGGMEANRGGVSMKVTPRLMLSVIAEVQDRLQRKEKRGFNDEERQILKQMVAFCASTYQGRHPGMSLGTAEQVYDHLDSIEDEVIACHLAIDGKLGMDQVAPKYAKYTSEMKMALAHHQKDAQDEFTEMRSRSILKMIGGMFRKNRIKHYVEQVGAPLLSVFTDISNRSIVRGGSVSGKFNDKASNVHESRAIHWAKVARTTLEHFDVSYTAGLFLRGIAEDYRQGHISKEDLRALWEDPYVTKFIYAQMMSVKPGADPEWGFDKIESDYKGQTQDKRWTVGRLFKMHKNEYKNIPAKARDNMAFHGTFVIDDLDFTSHYEALARTVYDDASGPQLDAPYQDIIDHMYDKDDLLNSLKFGKYTREQFPNIDDTAQRAKEMRFVNAAVHAINDRIKDGTINIEDPEIQSMLFNIGMAWRNWSVHNGHIVNDLFGFGARPEMKPALDFIKEHVALPEKGLDEELVNG